MDAGIKVGDAVEDDLDPYVWTAAFDAECINPRRRRERRLSDSNVNLLDLDDGSSPTNLSDEASSYDVPKREAYLYFSGLSGPSGRGPKLVYRTSKENEVFVPSMTYRRLMKLVEVPVSHKLGEIHDGRCLWDIVCDEVVQLLDKHSIQFTSVDLVRFRWDENQNEDEDSGTKEDAESTEDEEEQDVESEEDEEEEEEKGSDATLDYDDIASIPLVGGRRFYTTPATIWVGVRPDSTTGEQAHHAAMDILNLLKQYILNDVEVAFRESEVNFFTGPALFAPAPDENQLKDVIDNLSTALSVQIAGARTEMQGTLGFYFRVGDDLYAVTARHVLFKKDDSNKEFNCEGRPKKEVLVMSADAFADYLTFLKRKIGDLVGTIGYLEERKEIFRRQMKGNDLRATRAAQDLPSVKQQLDLLQAKMKVLKSYFIMVRKGWGKPKDRVIGHVVWAPPISVGAPPHSYTQDLCVIKLDKKKFCQFGGNILSLGPEISREGFIDLMYDHFDGPNEFEYPQDGLLKLRGILSETDIRRPNNMTPGEDPIQRVIKRGSTTQTTVGSLSGFQSHVRRYFITGHMDSIEAVILPHSEKPGPFARGGDSGSIIVDARQRFVALLTSGAGITDASDLTYGTPMHWLWPVIQEKFPGASLYWDDKNVATWALPTGSH